MTLKEWEKDYCTDCNIIIEKCLFCWEKYKKLRKNHKN